MADMQIILNDLEIRKIVAERFKVEVNRISFQFHKGDDGDIGHGGGPHVTATVRKDFVIPGIKNPEEQDST